MRESFLDDLASERRRLLERADEVAAVWRAVQDATAARAPGDSLIDADLDRLRAELTRRQFTIGLFGLIKRGKSTLLNALLGAELSPTHVTPETAVPVYVDHGDVPQATVHFASGESRAVAPAEVVRWTSQKHNPGNKEGVTHVQWHVPSPLLRHGVRIVDTPGLDDAEADDLYTRRTIQELEASDVGILVFLSPPTVGATEMAFLRDVTAAQVRRSVLVANLYPQHYEDLDTRAEVLGYMRRHLTEATGEENVRIHAVCAEEAWQARRYGDDAGWRAAGGAGLLAAIEEVIATNTGRQALARAEAALEQVRQVATAAVDLRLQTLAGSGPAGRSELATVHRDRLIEDVDRAIEDRLAGVDGMRAMLQAVIHQTFLRTRTAIRDARSVADLRKTTSRFSRELEVVTEDAFRQLRSRLMALHAEIDEAFDAGVMASLHDLGAVLPGSRILRLDDRPVETAPVTVRTAVPAALGGVVAGGAGFALVGALLGPVGMVAGALAGWRLGGVLGKGRELQSLRSEIDDQLSTVADEILAEFDRRVDAVVDAVRDATLRRRDGFEADLSDTVAVDDRFRLDAADREAAAAALRRAAARLRRLDGDNVTVLVPPSVAAAG